MPHEYINEPVEMRVDFCAQRTIPRTMYWNHLTYSIKQINAIHRDLQGNVRLFFFSVSDHLHYFKLQFNTETLEWRLLEMYGD